MAAPTFQAAGAGQTSTGATLSVPWPTHQADDLGLLVIETTGTSSTMSTPAGWNVVTGSPLVDVASVAGSKFYVFWRRASSSAEPNVPTGAQTDHQDAMIYTYRGVLNSGSPINISATATKAVASLTATCPTVTTTSADCLIVLVASRPNDSAATNHFANPVNAALTSLGEAAEWGTIDGDGGGFVVSHGTKAVAGVVGTSTMSKGSSTTDCTLTIALAPVAAAGSAPTYRAQILQRHRSLLRPNRRSGPVTPPTQTVVVTVSYVAPIIAAHRRLVAARRRQPVQVPPQTAPSVTVAWVPAVETPRRIRPSLRRRAQPQVPPLAIVYVPAIESPRRVRPLLRRRAQPATPLVALAYVPAIEVPRRAKAYTRRRTQPTVPPAEIVVVAAVSYVPAIESPRRTRAFLRRRAQPTVPPAASVVVAAAPYVPAIESPRRSRLLARRRSQPTTPPAAIVVATLTYVPPIGATYRLRAYTRRRTQPTTPIVAVTFTPPISRPAHRFYRQRRGTTARVVTISVTTTRPPQVVRGARRFAWLRRRTVQQPSTPPTIATVAVDYPGTCLITLVRADLATSLVLASQRLTLTIPAAVDDVGPTCHLDLVVAVKATTIVRASTVVALVAASTTSSPVEAGTNLAAAGPGNDTTLVAASTYLDLDAASGTTEIP